MNVCIPSLLGSSKQMFHQCVFKTKKLMLFAKTYLKSIRKTLDETGDGS
jgi:hypothetical protein